MRHTFILVLFFFLGLQSALATHIVGGEMTYRCLGNRQIELSLTVFRDCYNGVPPFDSVAFITLFDENWNYAGIFYPDFIKDDTIPVILTDPCLVIPPNVCVHRTTYKQIITLPNDVSTFRLVYQRCCRNQLIRNIVDPLSTGATFMIEITPKAIQECNNSPTFRQWPPVSICVNKPIDFDHGANDIDGDSIVYELCTPIVGGTPQNSQPIYASAGPHPEVVWNAPYGLNNVLGGQPLTIDPKTGFLTGVPNTIGNFVVGICAKEYRNGELISILRRDFQYNVADCGEPIPAFIAPQVQCDDLKVVFDNSSKYINFGYRWYFDWEGDKTLQSGAFEPSFTYPDTGTYVVALIANPGTPCVDTAFQTVNLAETHIAANFLVDFPACDSSLHVAVQDLSLDSVYAVGSWAWTIAGGSPMVALTSTEENPVFELSNSGNYKLTLVVTSTNGCTRTLTQGVSVNIPTSAGLTDTLRICLGQSVELFPDAPRIFTYSWSPTSLFTDPNLPNPIVQPSSAVTYSVVISDPNSPCTTRSDVTVLPGTGNLNGLNATANPPYILPGESTQLDAVLISGGQNATFQWSPSETLSASNIPNPIAQPQDTATYYVTVTEFSGCTAVDSVTIIVLRGNICEDPHVFIPTAFSPNGDKNNDVFQVEGKFIEEMRLSIFDRWGRKIFESTDQSLGWNGTFEGIDLPPDTYGYMLELRCIGGFSSAWKGNITLLR